jgi:hypothetical protein
MFVAVMIHQIRLQYFKTEHELRMEVYNKIAKHDLYSRTESYRWDLATGEHKKLDKSSSFDEMATKDLLLKFGLKEYCTYLQVRDSLEKISNLEEDMQESKKDSVEAIKKDSLYAVFIKSDCARIK